MLCMLVFFYWYHRTIFSSVVFLVLLTLLGYHCVILVDNLLSIFLDRWAAHCHFRDLILWKTSSIRFFCLIHMSLFWSIMVISTVHHSIDLWAIWNFDVTSLMSTQVSHVMIGSMYSIDDLDLKMIEFHPNVPQDNLIPLLISEVISIYILLSLVLL